MIRWGMAAALAVALTGTVWGQTANLERGFKEPPASAKPHTWWHWMNGNVSKDGITRDLEAMKRIGIGGAQIFNVEEGIPLGDTPFMSPQWRDTVKHAIREAKRLGIELCIHNCAGWSSSGGPWIRPEHAMQILTFTETPVTGPLQFSGKLPQPTTRRNYYQDIAVYAIRKPKTDGVRLNDIAFKAAFERGGRILPENRPTPEGTATEKDSVVLLTDRMKPDGTLAWDVPEGEWILLRLGHTPTGKENHPAPVAGRGLECDKMSREAMDEHWAGMMAAVLKDADPATRTALNNALIDSYEVGSQNWTPKFRAEFQKRRGYDPLPYMPTVTGRVIGSIDVSERFLWDFRRTIADLFAENYFAYFGELCHKNGLQFSVEPYGNGLFDNLQVGGLADITMGEFWIGGAASETIRIAASAAHTNGRTIVGAESFTADDQRGRWLVDPYSIKALGDRMFSEGLNRYIFHRYAHQPWKDLAPGMTMGPWGSHIERTQTWWDQGTAWMKYIARCQYLLQSGRFVADVVYFTGEDGPNDLPYLRGSVVPTGYNYDGCDATVLRKMRVENGEIVLPTGMRYRVLMLPDGDTMTPETLGVVAKLVEDGATVVGPKPQRSPSLVGYPACDAAVKVLADKVWGSADGKTNFENTYGKGRIYWGKPLVDVLTAQNIDPDVSTTERAFPVQWIHRKADSTDLYFVSNPRSRNETVSVSFRVMGRMPEIWNPETGATTPAPVWHEENGRTVVSLAFEPAGSAFVVFRKPSTWDHLTSVISEASRTAAPTKIEIVSARYEATDGAGGADVTQKVAEMVAAGESSIPATNANFGDPIPLHIKRLRVVYRVNGKETERAVGENDSVELLGPSDDTVPPEFSLVSRGNEVQLHAWKAGTYEVKTASGKTLSLTAPEPKKLVVNGSWTLTFPAGKGAPEKVTLPKLASWSTHSDPGVRYFSGSATYNIAFDVPADFAEKGKAIYLDLGRVKNFAEVTVNGKRLNTLWKAPFRVEVTSLVRPGKNTLAVRVTNLWPNRLIGDEQLPADVEWNGVTLKEWPEWLRSGKPRPKTGRVGFTTWHFYNKESPLLESGLLGPVTLYAVPDLPISY